MSSLALPAPTLAGNQRSYSISALWEGTPARINVDQERQLLNLVLPPWQRPPSWNLDQQVQFIEGIFLGLGTGYYVINGRDYDDQGHDKPMSGWLIDGQQRITAIARFFHGEISIFGGIFFQDLSLADKRRRFNNLIFPCIEMDYTDDEKVLKELYRRLNFSGTPHTEADLELLNA
ncbi:TPA: DUF262 domain-containing protein [Pseudomonas aeruginosa]|uniref:DUF262 domain-containing protein n=1 Tax=Pseudomonas aeruginosa TaxID=287 RepID=UPI00070EAF22|nr:DUF262 domain-containing protein [Pseudomonas aeruginosa]HCE5819915.1 DUF262 domain-containing protein [Pseudomonas aeruginosa]HCK4565455.1 DUF262 domain-containing protein [Pseudomonas aeruginosa]HCK4774295.1 DUF262 domain-containing protein [Pseudomonas aeruginosa]